ncbi:MAG: NRDE family protein [Rhodanobacter sp.]|jgi:uncharacterized protein with NRDE domain|nr:NRDE family protein [Rhodanobacter sp.]
MCLLLVAIGASPRWPFLLLGNRDEFHARASVAAWPWPENAHIVGGRDQVAGGAWLALRDDGRFAAVTNLRTGMPATAPKSRGWLVRDFVLGDVQPAAWLAALRDSGHDWQVFSADYGPFNLVIGDDSGVFAMNSADGEIRVLGAGVHAISNGPIGAHWPKTERLRRHFIDKVRNLDDDGDDAETRLFDLLMDTVQPPDAQLPDTGVGLELERRLAPIFIVGENYGTRAATLVARRADGSRVLRERRFGPFASDLGESYWQASPGGGFTEQA